MSVSGAGGANRAGFDGERAPAGIAGFREAIERAMDGRTRGGRAITKDEMDRALAALDDRGVTRGEKAAAVELFLAWAYTQGGMAYGRWHQVDLEPGARDALMGWIERNKDVPGATPALRFYALYEAGKKSGEGEFVWRLEEKFARTGGRVGFDVSKGLRSDFTRFLLKDGHPIGLDPAEKELLRGLLASGVELKPAERAEIQSWIDAKVRYEKFTKADAERVWSQAKNEPTRGADESLSWTLESGMGLTGGMGYMGDGKLRAEDVRYALAVTWPDKGASLGKGHAQALLKVLREHPQRVTAEARTLMLQAIGETLGI